MKARWIWPLVLLTALLVGDVVAVAGNHDGQRFLLFTGANTDSTEQKTRWIPITRGCTRILLCTFTDHAAFSGADTAFSDTISTFKVLLADSMATWGGVMVAQDTVQISGWGADSTKHVGVLGAPVNKALRGPVNGWGVWTIIYPTATSGVVTPDVSDHSLMPSYFCVAVTPLRRSTGATVGATVPNRVNGLKHLRMEAIEEFFNR